MARLMLGRIEDPADLPGGALLLMKAARKAGGWYTWATVGTLTKPVKVTAAAEAPDGKAVFEDRPFPRVLVKGIRTDAAFVVQYVAGKVDCAYVLSRLHNVRLGDDGAIYAWTTGAQTMKRATVAEVKAYIAGAEVPSTLSEEPATPGGETA